MKKLIFDTDLGGDCDDVMALNLLLACERTKECRLLGVTYSADARAAVPCIHAILRQHRRGDIPVGTNPVPEDSAALSDVYASRVAAAFDTPDSVKYADAPDAVRLLRRLLAENDGVTLCVTGFLTNIAALLRSGPDDISPLNGVELVAASAEELAIMGCSFAHAIGGEAFSEWNIKCDIPAAQTVFTLCPSPVVICPFEVGHNMITGAAMAARGPQYPDALCYILHGSAGGRDSWDPATALYAVRGTGDLFTMSEYGNCRIDDDGISYFEPGGNHRCLGPALTKPEIASVIDDVVSVLYTP
ncbi:MAG: nucleoside hydrolase [Eubacteriales bacterium]|nr:nucleoside hydrolase [Eubacteriales bacterium]